MRVLELFSGTHSVGKVCKEYDWEVVSVDLENADINIDILKWDYKKDYKEGDFDIIWASPPCCLFSNCRRSWIGRKLKAFGDEIVTAEMLDNDMIENGLPIVRKTQEIIEYFKPNYYFIENPQSGKMKNFLTDMNYYDVDYCKYSDWGYRKRTRIWTNNMDFVPMICRKDCENMFDPNKHKTQMSNAKGGTTGRISTRYRVPPKLINELLKEPLKRHRLDMAKQVGGGNNKKNLHLKYRVPPLLIKSLLEGCGEK